MIYEERCIQLKGGVLDEYLDWAVHRLWPTLESKGADPVCLLNGLIGASSDELLWIIGFKDYSAWESCQWTIAGKAKSQKPRNWIASEAVNLMMPSPYRPVGPVAIDERRAVYGARRWWIHPEDWSEFNRLSHDGVWPAMDYMGHHVIGQFRHAATTSPLEVLNLAGYNDVAHWHATRSPEQHDVPDALRDLLTALGRERNQLVQKSLVCLMRAHWPD